MTQDNLPTDIDELWVDRPSMNDRWEQHKNSTSALLVVGPPRSGKYTYAQHQHLKLRSARPSSRRQTAQNKVSWQDFRRDPKSHVSVIIHLPDYRPIHNIVEFYYNLRMDIVRLAAEELRFSEDELKKAMDKTTSPGIWTARGFLPALAKLFSDAGHFKYSGKITIFLCGLRFVYESNRTEFFGRLRQFFDEAIGNELLERFRIVLTSVPDTYFLLSSVSDVCSPLNCLRRITMEDLNNEEFDELLDIGERKTNIAFDDPNYLLRATCGDVYLTKVIMSICRRNLIRSPEDLRKKRMPVANELIDQAVESIITLERNECLPPFRVLLDYADSYDEVRDVLFSLWTGASSVPMVDTTGTYTIPESSGAVRKILENGKYVYVFRNPIYQRMVDLYFSAEQRKAQVVLDQAMGQGDVSFAATLASAIRHELGGSINILDSAIKRHRRLEDLPDKYIDALGEFEQVAERLTLLSGLLDGLKGQETRTERVVLNEYLERFLRVFKAHLSSRGITMRFRLGRDIKELTLDTAALQIALLQLLMNSRDAIMEKGRGVITISTELRNSKTVVISVIDDGKGMSRKTIASIMKSGFTTKRNHSGMGLALCQSAARRMGAEIAIRSSQGKGTTVSILLPVR